MELCYACIHIDILYVACSCSYSWPKKGIEDIPEKYTSIVDACLTVDPAVRPSIDTVLDMLDGIPSCEFRQPVENCIVTTIEQKTSTELHTTDVPNLIDL